MNNEFGSNKANLTFHVILAIAMLITGVAAFVPLSPEMPGTGLDPSWVYGMNQATAQGLSFGKDIIFTFGPYASIWTNAYHPITDSMMLYGSLYLSLSYWACFVLLMRGDRWRSILLCCGFLAGVMLFRDALLFSFPLVVALLTFKSSVSRGNESKIIRGKSAPLFIAALFAPFGLLALIKGTAVFVCAPIVLLCCVFFLSENKKLLAATSLLSPLVSMVLFWSMSGQAIADIPDYFISLMPIAFGYTEAMALDGSILEVALYLVAAVALMLAILRQRNVTVEYKAFLSCVYFVFLFLSFKAGFVRHDGHALISGTALLIAAFLVSGTLNTKRILLLAFPSLLAWAYIYNHYIRVSIEGIARNITATYSSAWQGARNRIEDSSWPRREFDASVDSIKKQASFPLLPGTTDIYSFNQSYLIASGNTWAPRPIFQSYSVYTPSLAEINRKHLLGSQAPDNIIFRVEPIDGRFPSLEDGASWPIMLINYEFKGMRNGFLFLHKRQNIVRVDEKSKLTTESHLFGERVPLPHSTLPVFAEFEIKHTIFGHIASIVFKPTLLEISVELDGGTIKQYRIISGMAKSGFVVSPLIENTADLAMLFGKGGLSAEKLVKAITISPLNGPSMLWDKQYTVTFSDVKTEAPMDGSD